MYIDYLMLSVFRRNRIIAITIFIPNLSIRPMNDNFSLLINGYLSCNFNCFCLSADSLCSFRIYFVLERPLSLGGYNMNDPWISNETKSLTLGTILALPY